MGVASSTEISNQLSTTEFSISILKLSEEGRADELERLLISLRNAYEYKEYIKDLTSDNYRVFKVAIKNEDVEVLKVLRRNGFPFPFPRGEKLVRNGILKAIETGNKDLIGFLAGYPYLAFGNGLEFVSSEKDKKLRKDAIVLAAAIGRADLIKFMLELKYIQFSSDKGEMSSVGEDGSIIVGGDEGIRTRRQRRGVLRSAIDVVLDIFYDAPEVIRAQRNKPIVKAAEGGFVEVIRVLKSFGLSAEDILSNRLEVFKAAIETDHPNFLRAIKTIYGRSIQIDNREDIQELTESIQFASENGYEEVLRVLEDVYNIKTSEEETEDEDAEETLEEEIQTRTCFDFLVEFEDVAIDEYLDRNPEDNIVIVSVKDNKAVCSSKSYLNTFYNRDRVITSDPYVKVPAIVSGGGIVYVPKTTLRRIVRSSPSERLFCLVERTPSLVFVREGTRDSAPVYKIVKCRR